MDSGRGTFEPISEELADSYREGTKLKPERAGGIFTVGEELEIRGSLLRVRKITRKDLILRVLRRVNL